LTLQVDHQLVQLVVAQRIRIGGCELVDRLAKAVEHQFDDTQGV
jgi:hypothetical protein